MSESGIEQALLARKYERGFVTMTKDQERNVLAQIVALIEQTPTDSYIRMAFMNVPDYAERNIEDDAGYNPVDERNMYERRAYECEQNYKQKLITWEHERDALADKLKACQAEIEKLGCLLDSKVAECERITAEKNELRRDAEGCNQALERLEQENIRLKAEIYDLERSKK